MTAAGRSVSIPCPDSRGVAATSRDRLSPNFVPSRAIHRTTFRTAAPSRNTVHFTEQTLCVGQAFQPAAAVQAALCRGLPAYVNSIAPSRDLSASTGPAWRALPAAVRSASAGASA